MCRRFCQCKEAVRIYRSKAASAPASSCGSAALDLRVQLGGGTAISRDGGSTAEGCSKEVDVRYRR
jgi:hypothetical protein